MPESQRPQEEALAKYDAMRTEELQQILREDASKPAGEGSDADSLLSIMEVLANRRKERGEGKSPEEALKSFKKHYASENSIPFVSENSPKAKKRNANRGWKRSLVTVAAMLALVIGSSLAARAFGFDLWKTIAKWTQETFHFGYAGETEATNAPGQDDATPYAGLQAVLDKHGVDLALAPTWIPNGYVEGDVTVEDTPLQRRFAAKYQLGDTAFKIRIAEYLSSAPAQVEQSDLLIEVYTLNDIDYYIFQNEDQLQVMWIIGNFECCISGSLTLSDVKTMIDSIEKG